MAVIGPFDGEYAFLSNFFMCSVDIDGIRYLNSEAAYQAQKCEKMTDRFQFANLLPGKAKRLGRKVKIRKEWEIVKDNVMYEVVRAKFQQHPELRDMLLSTGAHQLVELNTWGDEYWGVCNGRGQNKLGQILMRVREEFRSGRISSASAW